MTANATRSPAGDTHRSLRRRWNRRFSALAAVSLAGGLLSLFLVDRLVDRLSATAEETERETAVLAELGPALGAQHGLAHNLIDFGPDFSQPFLGADREVARLLDQAEHQLDERHHGHLAKIRSGSESMYAFLRPIAADPESAGSFETELGDDDPLHAQLAVDYRTQTATLDGLNDDIHAEAKEGLASARDLQQQVLSLVTGAAVLMVLFVLGLRRRFDRGVIRPVRELADAARGFGSGDLDRRPLVHQDDELGELAESFSRMADSLAANHARLVEQASQDSLTGLANRPAFNETLADVSGQLEQYGVLFVDLDDFKIVNDTMGHSAGDQLLQLVAERISRVVRGGDVVARLGGDEFAVILRAPVPSETARAVADRVLDEFAQPFTIEGTDVSVGASIGISLRPTGDDNPPLLVREADAAMYLAKSRGKNRVELFDQVVHADLLEDPARIVRLG